MSFNFHVISGLLLGVSFGFILQRGRFCMNSAFMDTILIKDFTILKAIITSIIVQMIGFLILVTSGIISSLNPRPFYVVSIMVGGLIFGIGMVLAGGCLSGTTYRIGEGMVGSIIAILGFFFIIILANIGVLTGITNFFNGLGQVTVIDSGPFVINNNPTLANIFGINPWILVVIIVVISIFFFTWKNKKLGEKVTIPKTSHKWSDNIFKKEWNWWVTGIALGIVGILAYPFSAAAGQNDAICLFCGWEGLSGFLMTGNINQMNWLSFLVIGMIFGSVIAATLADELKIRIPESKRLIQQFVGGVMLGFGAVLANGCNIGHIFSGIPQLALSSIVMGVFIFLGAWIITYFMFIREKG
ncbi:MAG: YeeE/YedE family protein [Promethearchaeota archaeon]